MSRDSKSPTELRLVETVSPAASSEFRVDRENFTIYGVAVLQEESRNGRIYTRQAREDAVPLYEDVPVHIGHKTGGDYATRVGSLINPRIDDRGIVIADWSVNKGHPLAEMIIEDALHRPKNLALSHEVPPGEYDAEFIGDGVLRVNRIFEMDIVSVVTNGGTNRSLLEELDSMSQEKKAVESLAEALLESLKDSGFARKNAKTEDALADIVARLEECACQMKDNAVENSEDLEENLKTITAERDTLKSELDKVKASLQEFLDKEAEESAKASVKKVMEELNVDAEKVGAELMKKLVTLEEGDIRVFLGPVANTLEEESSEEEGSEEVDQEDSLEEELTAPKSKRSTKQKTPKRDSAPASSWAAGLAAEITL